MMNHKPDPSTSLAYTPPYVDQDEDTAPLEPEDLLYEMVSGLLGHQEGLEISRADALTTIELQIALREEDKGKIIGKEGAIFNLLQEYFRRIGGRLKKTITLSLR